jgi:hypothetical protein
VITYILALLGLIHIESGPLSVYAPRDGMNRGVLACGGSFTYKQEHIAIRRYRRVGCGSKAIVCVKGRCVKTRVRDAGPFGIVRKDTRPGWKTCTKAAPPEGWRWRGAVDLSIGLWKRLGRPRFLTEATVIVLPRRVEREAPESLRQTVNELYLRCTSPIHIGHAAAAWLAPCGGFDGYLLQWLWQLLVESVDTSRRTS